VIVARITIRGQEHLAIALSADERKAMRGGAVESIDLGQILGAHLDLMMAFDGAVTSKIAIMTEETLAMRIAGCETAVHSVPGLPD
jgi:hypothetical protein